MGARRGADYVQGLRTTKREVWLEGKLLTDVVDHPALRAGVQQMAGIYDLQHQADRRDVMTFKSPTTGDQVNTSFMIAETPNDLVKKRGCYKAIAEATFGLMGRSPDFMNTMLSALYEGREVLARGGERFADNFERYFEYIRENDLLLTHALITPQNDRSKSSAQQSDPFLHMGVVREDARGLIVRGARMLATLGPIADEILIFNLPGLKPGDERHAVVFALPIDTPGLRQICRQPFDRGDRHSFDHPLASRFEECDSLIVFDDVMVPWDRVFAYNDVALCNALYPDTNVRQYTAHQSTVRGQVKLQTAVGVTMALASAVKADAHLHVQNMLGELVDTIEILKALILRSESEFETNSRGGIRPAMQPLQTARNLLPRAYPRAIEVLQTIGAGGLLMLPSAADFVSPIADLAMKFYQGADGMSGMERTRLFKLAWDLCGDAFGTRTLQYERYYAGDPVRILANTYLNYDKSECEHLVKEALALSGSPSATAESKEMVA